MCTQEEKKPLPQQRSLDGTVYMIHNAENVPSGAGAVDEQQMPLSATHEALGSISSTEKCLPPAIMYPCHVICVQQRATQKCLSCEFDYSY